MKKIFLMLSTVALIGCSAQTSDSRPTADSDTDNTETTLSSVSSVESEITVSSETTTETTEQDYTDTSVTTSNLTESTTSVTEFTESGDSYLTEMLTFNDLEYTDISDSNRLIVVDSEGFSCNVYLYQKNGGIWSQIKNTYGYIGKEGVTDNKTESDWGTPTGLYTLGFGFGTEEVDTNIKYRVINNNCYWIDDPSSPYYNQWVESEDITWNSAEHLIDYPVCYHYSIVINYNMNPVISGKGSAIFLHCTSQSYTAGCVAVPEETMLFILQWLDGNSTPYILISK